MSIRKILKIVLLIICVITFSISINLIIQKYIQDYENKNANDNLIKIITKKAEMKDEEKIENEETKNKIDWNKLSSINSDIVGWIEIPNTNINYPILKDENLYYLNHNFERKINTNGSIFIRNENLSEDKEITIYGHNMKNGTMFANLAKYINKDFFENNSKIYIYTKEETFEGNIFAVYSKGVNEEKEAIKKLNLADKLEYYKKESVNSGKIESVNLDKIENNANKIIKLTTCSYINAKTNPTDQRYYVIANMQKNN